MKGHRSLPPFVVWHARTHNDHNDHTTPAARDALRTGSWLMLLTPVAMGIYGLKRLFGEAGDRFHEAGIFYNAESGMASKEALGNFNQTTLDYVAHLHNAYSGLLIATAFATGMLVWYGVRSGRRWAWLTALFTPLFAAVVTLGRHFGEHFDSQANFLLLTLLPLLAHIVGAVIAHRGVEKMRDHRLTMTGSDREIRART